MRLLPTRCGARTFSCLTVLAALGPPGHAQGQTMTLVCGKPTCDGNVRIQMRCSRKDNTPEELEVIVPISKNIDEFKKAEQIYRAIYDRRPDAFWVSLFGKQVLLHLVQGKGTRLEVFVIEDSTCEQAEIWNPELAQDRAWIFLNGKPQSGVITVASSTFAAEITTDGKSTAAILDEISEMLIAQGSNLIRPYGSTGPIYIMNGLDEGQISGWSTDPGLTLHLGLFEGSTESLCAMGACHNVTFKWNTGETALETPLGLYASPAPVHDGAVNVFLRQRNTPVFITDGPNEAALVRFGVVNSSFWAPADGDGVDISSPYAGPRVYAVVDGAGHVRLISAGAYYDGTVIATAVVALNPDTAFDLIRSDDVVMLYYGGELIASGSIAAGPESADPDELGSDFVLSIAAGGASSDTGNATVSVRPRKPREPVPADLDADGDVDQLDVQVFQECASGPALPVAANCEPADLDKDSDVDMTDFGLLQACYSGTDMPAVCSDPTPLGCAECAEIPVGYALSAYFPTQQTCEQLADHEGTYSEAHNSAERFCIKWYKCIDPACPGKLLHAPPAEEVCRCEHVADGPHKGQWVYVCDMIYEAECCCEPEL